MKGDVAGYRGSQNPVRLGTLSGAFGLLTAGLGIMWLVLFLGDRHRVPLWAVPTSLVLGTIAALVWIKPGIRRRLWAVMPLFAISSFWLVRDARTGPIRIAAIATAAAMVALPAVLLVLDDLSARRSEKIRPLD